MASRRVSGNGTRPRGEAGLPAVPPMGWVWSARAWLRGQEEVYPCDVTRVWCPIDAERRRKAGSVRAPDGPYHGVDSPSAPVKPGLPTYTVLIERVEY